MSTLRKNRSAGRYVGAWPRHPDGTARPHLAAYPLTCPRVRPSPPGQGLDMCDPPNGATGSHARPQREGRHAMGGAPHPPQPSKKRVLGRPCGTWFLQWSVARGTTFTQQDRCARLDLEGDLVHEVPHQQDSSARDGLEPWKGRTVTGETFTEGAVGRCFSP